MASHFLREVAFQIIADIAKLVCCALQRVAHSVHTLVLCRVLGCQRLVHAVAHTGEVLAVFLDQICQLVHPPVLRAALLRHLAIQIVAQIDQLQALILRACVLCCALLHHLLVQIRANIRKVLVLVLQTCIVRRTILGELLVKGLANAREVLMVLADVLIKSRAHISKVLPVVLNALV